ncbi:DUF3093 domain-containing protein [Nocardioides mangrovi]|uniref:DUF3093 domain-containing protein n=1 Tax=Nocardioides mangrovi TaxID=2874580 RepID=A0ABS7UCR2_9ACTN|nr:DUF3093 domain-containing protein [Nocardioides mangrovi]MBZ5738667.1 DUF3093 domain-containing protein [Nocardioides mangrovi]
MSTAPTYTERLGVPLRWWVQGVMFIATLWLAVVVAVPGLTAWIVTAVALALLASGFLSYGSARLAVADGTFRAGAAHIAGQHLGEARALDAEETRRTAGMHADARAFLLLRPYLKRAVKVEITDPADPAPYWLVSTRHPEELAKALTALVQAAHA